MTTISGRVTLHGGDKVAATATVELRNSQGDTLTQTTVDEGGRYRFHVKPGDWSLNLWDAFGHRGRIDVSVAEGEDKDVSVDLEEPEGGH